jgi:hypothetical protein
LPSPSAARRKIELPQLFNVKDVAGQKAVAAAGPRASAMANDLGTGREVHKKNDNNERPAKSRKEINTESDLLSRI